jgi:hypothetical protein
VSDKEICITVEVREDTGKVRYQVNVKGESPGLVDLLDVVAHQAWGMSLFEETEESTELKAGHILVLDRRLIQPWEIEEIHIADGQMLNFVPVVAGG